MYAKCEAESTEDIFTASVPAAVDVLLLVRTGFHSVSSKFASGETGSIHSRFLALPAEISKKCFLGVQGNPMLWVTAMPGQPRVSDAAFGPLQMEVAQQLRVLPR